MFKLTIKKQDIITNELFDETLEGIQSQFEFHKSIKSFGENEHSYEKLVSEEISEILDEVTGEVISPLIPAVYETINVSAEYLFEITNISEQINKQLINEQSKAFLRDTDWKVLRHIRQKALNETLSLSEEEYLELEQQRSLAASSISE